MLKIEGLSASYGKIQVLHDLNIEVGEGEIVTLIGANGAGKSTTLRSITGLVTPTSGKITFNGQEITNMRPNEIVKRGITLVPEGREIFPELTVRENLAIGAYSLKNQKDIGKDYEKVFELFPILKSRTKQYGKTLSGGEQQMLAIARALMAHPRMLCLDEPSMGLAPLLVEKIFDIIVTINKDENIPILLIEQNARMALSIANRGYVIETGRIVLEDKAENLLNNPTLQAAYLGTGVE